MRRVVLVIALLLSVSPGFAGKPEVVQSGASYVAALRIANEFLQAWSHRDSDTGLDLMSHRLRASKDEGDLRQYVEGLSNPHHQGFEIGAGVRVDSTRYSFPVVFYVYYSAEPDADRAEGTLQLVRDQGEWRVDSLPAEGR